MYRLYYSDLWFVLNLSKTHYLITLIEKYWVGNPLLQHERVLESKPKTIWKWSYNFEISLKMFSTLFHIISYLCSFSPFRTNQNRTIHNFTEPPLNRNKMKGSIMSPQMEYPKYQNLRQLTLFFQENYKGRAKYFPWV